MRQANLNGLRAHLMKQHGICAEQAYLMFRNHPGPCTQCSGPVKFMSFQTGYERLCGTCNKKNSQLRGASHRKEKSLPAWNRGLTEKTSESVRKSVQGCRDFISEHGHWRTGHTKENDPSVTRAAEKISQAITKSWASGTHGMIGKNGSNHEGIKARGESISRAFLGTDKHWSHKANAKDIVRRILETRKRLINEGTRSPLRMSLSDITSRIDALRDRWVVSDFVYTGHGVPVQVTCMKCEGSFTFPFNLLYKGKCCPTCFPSNYSAWHRQFYEFFLTLDPRATVNDRSVITPYELDIVSEDRKFAVECNGLYWHSEAMGTHPMYHQEKSDRARGAGVSLLHVFDDEWDDQMKQEIVKSMVRVKLGMANKVMARKMSLHVGKPVNVATFLAENHLDGNTPASKAFWLQDNDGKITCALTLRKPHQQGKWGSTTCELARVATLRDNVVMGGMSRLIEAAAAWARQEGYDRMITYRDMRLGGSGIGYERSGFTFNHLTKPRFWWTNGQVRIDRFAVRALPDRATQEEMAMEHKLFKIFGCSNAVYVKDLC